MTSAESTCRESTAIVLFRRDLRLHDHEPLRRAMDDHKRVVAMYCFDPFEFGRTRFGFTKTGPHRAKFIVEAVADLRCSIRERGGELVIRRAPPAAALVELASQTGATTLYLQQLIGTEETRLERTMAAAMRQAGVDVHAYANHTLLHEDDLPFDVQNIPDLFTNFRHAVEKQWHVRSSVRDPGLLTQLSLPAGIQAGDVPELAALGIEEANVDSCSTMSFQGGETTGKARLAEYFWSEDRLRIYKETRNGMLSPLDSSRLSAWLAQGCLSPRFVAEEVARYERERVANDSTHWLIFELLWRDYFSFITQKHGRHVFQRGGIRHVDLPWDDDPKTFQAWQSGRTGYPLVDANMIELARTGYMSNRGRQNVASFLTKNLNLDWRMGAEWFESCLIDYDPGSNYGNWNYVAGVGNDARQFRFFNIIKQSGDYDPKGDYVRHWLPILRAVPDAKVHQPWTMTDAEQKVSGVAIGRDYPRPMVDLLSSATENERRYKRALGIRQKH